MQAQFHSSFSPLASRYDAFILDLWGVIHDGQNLYPGAKECLKRLRGEGKKIVLLSNAPRRAYKAAEVLTRMGIGSDEYDALITSGEATYQCLADAAHPFFRPKGDSYVYIGLERDRNILDGLPFHETDDPAKAHFLLLSHSFYDNQPMAELEPLLKRCLAAGLPALCVNPDTEVVRITGERVVCAGVIAAEYAARGGNVIYFGKPHPFVYARSLEVLAGIAKERILAVGDNLATDIKGAQQAGIASALITGGVLKTAAGTPGTVEYKTKCEALCAEMQAAPDFVVPVFA
jgi:HAD superfamily hydrolase (TIGR01459 family)